MTGSSGAGVYLHYFKDGPPSIKLGRPSFAGMGRMVLASPALPWPTWGRRARCDRQTGLFLGAEKECLGRENAVDSTFAFFVLSRSGGTTQVRGLPNHLMPAMVRKVGGFTFQGNGNLSIERPSAKPARAGGGPGPTTHQPGPDYHHWPWHADTAFPAAHPAHLVGKLRSLSGNPRRWWHALQETMTELTYELVQPV